MGHWKAEAYLSKYLKRWLLSENIHVLVQVVYNCWILHVERSKVFESI